MAGEFRKFHTSNAGVSEIIATLLLLSITVVITSTVWLWMEGFVPSGKSKSPSVSAYVDLSDVDKGYVYVFISDVSETVGVSDVRVQIYNSDGAAISNFILENETVYGRVFMDSDHNGKLSKGDFFVFSISTVNGGGIMLFYIPTNALMLRQDIAV